jgi:hypothetical protein
MRIFFVAVFQHKITESSQNNKAALSTTKKRDPYQASLHACNKAAAGFKKLQLYFSAVF